MINLRQNITTDIEYLNNNEIIKFTDLKFHFQLINYGSAALLYVDINNQTYSVINEITFNKYNYYQLLYDMLYNLEEKLLYHNLVIKTTSCEDYPRIMSRFINNIYFDLLV